MNELVYTFKKNILICNGKETQVRLYSQYTVWYARFHDKTLYRGYSRTDAEAAAERFYTEKLTDILLKKRGID